MTSDVRVAVVSMCASGRARGRVGVGAGEGGRRCVAVGMWVEKWVEVVVVAMAEADKRLAMRLGDWSQRVRCAGLQMRRI